MKKKNAFSLVELIVVIAIIGILASVVFVSLGNQRRRAHQAGAIESVKSAMPFAVSCLINSGNVNSPSAGDYICGTSGEKWPFLPGTCVLGGDSTKATITNCLGESEVITCNFDTADCK